MPLHKKRPFPLVEARQNLDPGELVYQIRFTKEILLDYKYPLILILLYWVIYLMESAFDGFNSHECLI